jgi:hypothetical protein
MAEESGRITELELEVVRLMHEVDRYRTASEDALQQLDWCIGYFVGAKMSSLATSLGENRAHIRQQVRRSAQPTPTTEGEPGRDRAS